MKKIIISFLTLALFMSACAKKITTATAFFKEFQQAAVQKDEKKLRQLTVSYTLKKPKIDLQDAIVLGIQQERPIQDFAYSDAALSILVNDHLDKFEPIDAATFIEVQEEFGFAEHPSFKKLTKDDILVFDYNDVYIILFKIDGSLKLFFWEDLTSFE